MSAVCEGTGARLQLDQTEVVAGIAPASPVISISEAIDVPEQPPRGAGDGKVEFLMTEPDPQGGTLSGIQIGIQGRIGGDWPDFEYGPETLIDQPLPTFQPVADGPIVGPVALVQVPDLINGQIYRLRVRADNEFGAGSWSEWVSFVPGRGTSAPIAVTVTEGSDGTANVSWDEPNDVGGHAIQQYKVEAVGLGLNRIVSGTTLEASFSGLEPGRQVTFRVSASNGIELDAEGFIETSYVVPFGPAASSVLYTVPAYRGWSAARTAAVDEDGSVVIRGWGGRELARSAQIALRRGDVSDNIRWSPDNQYVATTGADEQVLILDAGSGDVVESVGGLITSYGAVDGHSFRWLASGELIIRTTTGHVVVDPAKGKREQIDSTSNDYLHPSPSDDRFATIKRDLSEPGYPGSGPGLLSIGRTDDLGGPVPTGILAIDTAWMPDGRSLLVSTVDETWSFQNPAARIELVDAVTLERTVIVDAINWPCMLEPSPDGQRFVTGSCFGATQIYSIDGTKLWEDDSPQLDLDTAREASWSPDGRYVVGPACIEGPELICGEKPAWRLDTDSGDVSYGPFASKHPIRTTNPHSDPHRLQHDDSPGRPHLAWAPRGISFPPGNRICSQPRQVGSGRTQRPLSV